MNTRQVLSLYETLSLPQAEPAIDYNNPANKIPTPVDERGLIRIPQLLIAVRATLDPEYRIDNERQEDDHHFYFYGHWYPYIAEGTNPHTFRNLSMHIGRMPRLFHQWIEKVTIPAEPPSPQTMQRVIETHMVHKNVVRLEIERKRSERSLKKYHEGLDHSSPEIHRPADNERSSAAIEAGRRSRRYERGLARHKQQLESIPEDFRLVDADQPMPAIAAQLGGYVIKRSIRTRRYLVAA